MITRKINNFVATLVNISIEYWMVQFWNLRILCRKSELFAAIFSSCFTIFHAVFVKTIAIIWNSVISLKFYYTTVKYFLKSQLFIAVFILQARKEHGTRGKERNHGTGNHRIRRHSPRGGWQWKVPEAVDSVFPPALCIAHSMVYHEHFFYAFRPRALV